MHINQAITEAFQREILGYYAAHGRHDLPWRRSTDPWRILLAEMSLRKTTAQQASSVFSELTRMSPRQLADADIHLIESIVRPLGLQNLRAKNLKETAHRVSTEGVERLRDEAFLRSLPGVGHYITNAVLCSAFGVPRSTIDTNVIRILERVFDFKSHRSRPREDQAFWDLAQELLPEKYPRQFNWGLLDLGANICTAKSPRCSVCPLNRLCAFHKMQPLVAGEVEPHAESDLRLRRVLTAPENPESTEPLTVVSLFSGAGGFDWGFHRAGFKTLLACEILPDAAQTLASNLKLHAIEPSQLATESSGVVVHGDVQQVDFSHLSLSPDVLIGGPPCQDFSVAQSTDRQGLNGGRGHLYREFVRAVMYLQPKIFVFENVPGLQSANRGRAYKTILGDLMNLEMRRQESVSGSKTYLVPAHRVEDYVPLFDGIVDAVSLGIPQTRRRLIIVGMRKDLFEALSPREKGTVPMWLRQQLEGYSLHFSQYPMTSLEVFEGKPLPALGTKYREIMEQYQDLAHTANHLQAAEWHAQVYSKLTLDVMADYLTANGVSREFAFSNAELEEAMTQHEALLKKMGWLDQPIDQREFSDGTHAVIETSRAVTARMRHIPPEQGAKFVRGTPWQVESKDISFIYRRTSPLKPAYTVMAYGGGGTHGYHYERDRTALTLRERARIQTFSDDFVFLGKHQRAQIGEAVPPLLGQCIAESVRRILDLTA